MACSASQRDAAFVADELWYLNDETLSLGEMGNTATNKKR
jgi:hypothetical protein